MNEFDLEDSEFDFAELLQRYEQSVSKNESTYFDVEELEDIADYYLQRNRTRESSRAVELGLRLHPMSSELQIKRARVYFALNELQKAMNIVRRLDAIEKNDLEILILKAALHIAMEQTKEATDIYNLLIGEYAEDAEDICMDAAYAFMFRSKFVEALSFLQKALAINSKSIDVLSEMAFCYEQLLENDHSAEIYNRILDINPYSAEAWFNLGQIHFGNEKYEEAIDCYDFATAIDEKDYFVWELKGHAYFQQDKMDEAIEAYSKYEELTSGSAAGKIYLGECYERLENYNVACMYFVEAMLEDDENVDAWTGIGVCQLELENFEAAIFHLEKAIELDATQSEPWVYLAEAHIGLEKEDEALFAYEHSIALDPNQPDTLVAIGGLYFDRGDFQQALASYLEARELAPDTEDLSLFLSITYFKLQQYNLSFRFLADLRGNEEALEYFLEMCPEAMDLLNGQEED
jgi:tetratricopeptide (TPR) repeat protein